VVSIFSILNKESLGVIMVDVVIVKVTIGIKPFNMSISFLQGLAITIIDEEPSDMSSLMWNVLI
jgi:hypothetical protein